MPVCSSCGKSVERGYTIIRNKILCGDCSEQLESLDFRPFRLTTLTTLTAGATVVTDRILTSSCDKALRVG